MAGSHLERTGLRHGVLAVAALGALVAALWSSSSFIGPLSDRPFSDTPTIHNAYSVASRFSIAILVLNAITALVITVMALIVDWHFDLRIPAYAEYAWVAVVLCIEIIGITLTGVSAPPNICSPGDGTTQMSPSEVVSGKSICSNWKAILFSSLIALVTLIFHLTWHIVFRVWHRSALSNRPNTPVNIWKTPLPRNYPTSPREKQKVEDPNFMTLEENGSAPADSEALDPYNLMFAPVATRKAQRSAKVAAKEHAAQASPMRLPVEDSKNAASRDGILFKSSASNPRELTPPGLEIVFESRKFHSKESS